MATRLRTKSIALSGKTAEDVANVLQIPSKEDFLNQNVYLHARWRKTEQGWILRIQFERG